MLRRNRSQAQSAVAVGVLIVFALVGIACGSKESEPSAVARAYVAAVMAGNTADVIDVLDANTVSRLEAAAQRATDQIGGRRQILAPEMLQITGYDPLFVIDRIVEVSADTERAELQIIGVSGQTETLMLVNGERGWRVALRVPQAVGGSELTERDAGP